MADLRALLDAATAVPDAEVPAVLTLLASVQATLATRLLAANGASSPASPPSPSPSSAADRMLTAHAAAALAGVSPKWLYRHAGRLPFARRLSPGVLRFEEAGLRRWLATRRARHEYVSTVS